MFKLIFVTLAAVGAIAEAQVAPASAGGNIAPAHWGSRYCSPLTLPTGFDTSKCRARGCTQCVVCVSESSISFSFYQSPAITLSFVLSGRGT